MDLDLGQLFAIILNKIKVIILVTVLFAVGAFAATKVLITPMYQSSGTMYVYNNSDRQDATITSSDLSTSQKLVDTYIVIMQSDAVLSKVAEDSALGYTQDEIKSMFSASAVNSTEVFRVTITNSDPHHAQIIANSFLKVAPEEIIRVVKAGAVEVVDDAMLPTRPSSPNVKMNLVIGALLGFIISVLAVVLQELLNTKIRSEDDVTKILELPILGIVPTIHVSLSEKGDS